MTLLPPVSGASGSPMCSVMSPLLSKTPPNTAYDERKPLRHILRVVSASPLTLESGVEAGNTASRPSNKRGRAGASRVKKTLLLGGLLLLGGMAWRGGAAGIATIRPRYQDEPERFPHGFYPDNASVGAFSPYFPPPDIPAARRRFCRKRQRQWNTPARLLKWVGRGMRIRMPRRYQKQSMLRWRLICVSFRPQRDGNRKR